MQRLLFRLSTGCSLLIALQVQAQQRVHIPLKDGNGALPVIENATDTVVGTIPLGIMPQEQLGRTRDLILNANGMLSVIDPTRGVIATINVRRAIGLLTSSTAAEKTSPTHASEVFDLKPTSEGSRHVVRSRTWRAFRSCWTGM